MGALDDVRLSENNDPRCPCVLLLDTSGSMRGGPIAALNDGLCAFQEDIQKDPLAARRVEIAIVTFGAGGVQVWNLAGGRPEPVTWDAKSFAYSNDYFVEAGEFRPPTLTAGGSTPMGPAIECGLDLLRERKARYNQHGIPYYRPWAFLITDGAPDPGWEPAAQRVRSEDNDAKKGVAFFAVGVPPHANLEILGQISPRQPVMLRAIDSFTEMFVWLSQSQGRVSAGAVGAQTSLPPIGWGAV